MAFLAETSFQRILRQWEQLTPQNAAQVLWVEGTPDPDLVESAFQATLLELGLGRVHLSSEAAGYSHEVWSGDPPAPLVSQQTGEEDVLTYITAELNRPFPAPPALPYRAFALQRPDGCYLGLICQQWVADNVSINLLLREWFLRVYAPEKARRKLISLPDAQAQSGPRVGSSPLQLFLGARDLYRWWRQSRSLTRFAASSSSDYHVSLHPVVLQRDQIRQLLLRTRAEGVGLDDLVIAVLAATLGTELPYITGQAWASPQGRRVAIASVLDLRPYAPSSPADTYGFLLAYLPVLCGVPAENLLDLAQATARQTRSAKDPAVLARRLLLPRLVARTAGRKSAEDLPAFFRHRVPTLASVTHLDLNQSWLAEYHPAPIRQYLRVGSPLPAMPIAVSLSTLGEGLTLTLAIQNRVVSDEAARRIVTGFAQRLTSLVQ